MPGERQPVFVCTFVTSAPEALRTVERIAAPGPDHALHHFTVLLSPRVPGWIDVRDEEGVLLRTQYWPPALPERGP